MTLSPLKNVNRSLSFALDFKLIEPGNAEHVAALVEVARVADADDDTLEAGGGVTDVTNVVVGIVDDACVLGMH